MGSQTTINGCGLFLGKAGILTALDIICLLYGTSGENTSKTLLVYHINTLVQPFCVLLDQLIFNKSCILLEIVFYALLEAACAFLSLPSGFSFSGC